MDHISCAEAQHDKVLGRKEQVEEVGSLPSPVHLVGVGGIGMSALARILVKQGFAVSGSDKQESEITQQLSSMGVRIFVGHEAQNVKDAKCVVVSTAITKENPELAAAQKASLPVFHRSQVLAFLARNSKLIAVSGTHGKTTTTGMVSQVLLDCDLKPSVVVGGVFSRIGANSCLGEGEYFVAEADESDGTHVSLKSYISIVTNVEADHLENYPGGIDEIYSSMQMFLKNSSKAVVVCADDPGCMRILPGVKSDSRQIVTYGKKGSGNDADYTMESVNGFEMAVFKAGKELGHVSLKVPGEHNQLNALAAVAVGELLGIEFERIAGALANFTGVDRRFQILGEAKGMLVVDDYAHHPTELQATLHAAKEYIRLKRKAGTSPLSGTGRLVAVFQPHQPGRLRDLWNEFAASFGDADIALVADVYVARGGQIEGINSKRLVESIKHPDVHYLAGGADALPALIMPYIKPNDLVMTIGAGDITKVGPELLSLIRKTNG